MEIKQKLKIFYITSIFSMVFAVLGFSYNTWRMELSEENNNLRTASFEVLLQLSELEQIIYAIHYDNDIKEGSPRKGWVKVGLVNDLSSLIGGEVKQESLALKKLWGLHWQDVPSDEQIVQLLVSKIDSVRLSIKHVLEGLAWVDIQKAASERGLSDAEYLV